ncbi:protein trachealess-like isoform X2 [Mya arenaria]|uniref:protein trachealess-like isoform X2 n=1 Tax=Mya arenaria TaxID=6604 RepID=UPI0022E6F6FD|nr:protein trachealess-like isoform X2 [Mya arenaria]
MNDQTYFHWDFFRPQIHSPTFAVGGQFLDIREDAMRGIQNKAPCKPFSLDQSCAFWSKDIGLESADGFHNVGGRVLEIRKEKSRDAARSRRGKENYEFYELAKLLPLPAAITSQLDKASIIRLSISYLKLRDFCGHGDPPWNREVQSHAKLHKGQRRGQTSITADLFELHQGAHILQSLDGFAFTLSNDGRFLYISETVSVYLGLSQVEMAGSSIFDYVHTQDHQEMADELGISLSSISSTLSSPTSPLVESPKSARAVTPPMNDRVPLMVPGGERGYRRTFCIRMKSTLTKRGVHSRTSGYRVLLICGKFRSQFSFTIGQKSPGPLLGLSGVAIALPPPSITELRIESDTFIMRFTSKFKVIYCENVISTLTDWKSDELSGRDVYTLCHPGDIQLLRKAHDDLLAKGQVLSPCVRLLNKGGGYIWVQICCTSLFTSKTTDEQTVLAIIQTMSIEHRGVAMDTSQMQNVAQPVCSSSNQGDLEAIADGKASVADSPDLLSKDTDESQDGSNEQPPEGASAEFHTTMEQGLFFEDSIDKKVELAKHDNRLSRRKADRPRKRRRDSDECSPVAAHTVDISDNSTCDLICRHNSVSEHGSSPSLHSEEDSILNLSSANPSIPSSPLVDTTKLAQATPEDLSLRSKIEKMNGEYREAKIQAKITDKNISSTVQDLEKAMSRHLPSKGKSSFVETTSRLDHNWTGPFYSFTPGLYSAHNNNIYASRESVIRTSLTNRVCSSLLDSNQIQPSSDLSIHKDQLQINIPHISIHNKQKQYVQSDILSLADELIIPTQPCESTAEKCGQGCFTENDDVLGLRTIHRNPKFTYASATDPINDIAKQPFLSVPNYPYVNPSLSQYANSSSQSVGAMFETRADGNSMWYGASYPT